MASMNPYDVGARPILEQQSKILNKLLEQNPIPGVTPIKILSDHDIKNNLYQKIEDYKYPMFNQKTYNQYNEAILSEKRKLYFVKVEHYKNLGKTCTDTFLEDSKGFRKNIVEDGGSFFGYDWNTREYFSDPLQYQSEIVDLGAFTGDINFYPDSQNLNLASTLVAMLDRCERKGFGMEQLKSIFHKLCLKYLPHLAVNADQCIKEDHIMPMFKLIVEHIDLTQERNKIAEAREKVSRSPNEDLQAVIGRLRHILLQQISCNNPLLSPEQREEAAELLLIQELPSFITPQCHTRLKQMTKDQLALGLFPTLTDYCRNIQDIENLNPEFRPKVTMKSMNQEDGILQTALTANQNVDVNFVSSGMSRSNNKERGRSPGRYFKGQRSGRSPGRDKSPRKPFFKHDKRNYQSRSKSPYQKNFSTKKYSPAHSPGSNYRRSSSTERRGNENRSNQYKGSDRGYTPRRQSRSSSNPRYPPRGRSFGRDSRSSSRDGRNNRRQSQSPGQRGQRGGFQRSSSRDRFSREKSPVSYNQNQEKAKYPKSNNKVFCNKCASTSHKSENCFRYPKGRVEKYCHYCLQHDRKLFHQEEFCRFKKSFYRSPSHSKNYQRS